MNNIMLTATQEDYLEVIYQLGQAEPEGMVRVTDIAHELKTKLPTVTRTVRRLTLMGLLEHPHRQRVSLSDAGRKMASDIRHRHTDLATFFTDVLGLEPGEAEQDACKIEHGLSPRTAQRLHEFLEYFQQLPQTDQARITAFQTDTDHPREQQFKNLLKSRIRGWRG
jgi:DtxR family Mn-dependent transcriptional regulator